MAALHWKADIRLFVMKCPLNVTKCLNGHFKASEIERDKYLFLTDGLILPPISVLEVL